jgi:gamma-glutamylcysteine synthetase
VRASCQGARCLAAKNSKLSNAIKIIHKKIEDRRRYPYSNPDSIKASDDIDMDDPQEEYEGKVKHKRRKKSEKRN